MRLKGVWSLRNLCNVYVITKNSLIFSKVSLYPRLIIIKNIAVYYCSKNYQYSIQKQKNSFLLKYYAKINNIFNFFISAGQEKIIRAFSEIMKNMNRMKACVRPAMCKPYGKQSESLQKSKVKYKLLCFLCNYALLCSKYVKIQDGL